MTPKKSEQTKRAEQYIENLQTFLTAREITRDLQITHKSRLSMPHIAKICSNLIHEGKIVWKWGKRRHAYGYLRKVRVYKGLA